MTGGPSWSPRPATATTRSAWPAGSSTPTGRPARSAGVRHGREPDGVLLKACGTRRESRCPSCAATYRADAYQLLAAGLKGGKGVPETVAEHPRLFVTFTAPSFGRVHTRKAQGRLVLPCHPYRQGARCPHGIRDGCWHRHDEDDPRLGEPLCPSCYDAEAQVLWNALAPELWRRTTIAVQRALARLVGLDEAELRQAGPRLLCQGGRVPAARGDPLPRRHPPGRGHRLPLPRLPGPTTRAVHRCPPRGRPTAGGPGRPGALPAPRRRAGPVCPLGGATRRPQHHQRTATRRGS